MSYNQTLGSWNLGFGSVESFFDLESIALDVSSVKVDSSLGTTSTASAQYSWILGTLYISAAPDFHDVIHELVHAIDYAAGWDQVIGDTNSFEGLGYTAEWLIALTESLNKITIEKFSSAAQAQTAWNTAWHQLNSITSDSVEYKAFGFTKDRYIDNIDIANVKNFLGFQMNATVLLPIYNSYFETVGLGSTPLTNNFNFQLDPYLLGTE